MNLEIEISEQTLITQLREYQAPCSKQSVMRSGLVSTLISNLISAQRNHPLNQQEYQEKKRQLNELLSNTDFLHMKQEQLDSINDSIDGLNKFLK